MIFKPNYIISTALLLLPVIVLVLFQEFIGNNINLLPIVAIPYIIVLIYFSGGDCPRCSMDTAKHPEGFWAAMTMKCRFCGKSFIYDKFDDEFDGIKEVKSKINIRIFIKEGAFLIFKFILLMLCLLFIKCILSL